MIIGVFARRKRVQKCSGHYLRTTCAGPPKSCHGIRRVRGFFRNNNEMSAEWMKTQQVELRRDYVDFSERKKEENGFGTERDAVLQTAFPLQDIAFSCTGDEARWSCFETWNYCSESGRGAAAVCHGRTSGRTGNRAAEHRRGERRRWGRC